MASQPVTTTIPRFLLPAFRSRRVRHRVSVRGLGSVAEKKTTGQFVTVRFASSAPPSKQPVLEKPARFNPPSHGSRLPKRSTTPRHYGGELSEHEVKAQEKKEYPGLMAPKGTWAHWLWNSRGVHMFISLGTLASLATYTFVENFKRTSPYVDMLPAFSEFFTSPITSTRTLLEVVKLNTAHRAAIVQEQRARRVDDVAKRKEYRKAHGIPETKGLPWLANPEPETEPAAAPLATETQAVQAHVPEPRKKWMGIF